MVFLPVESSMTRGERSGAYAGVGEWFSIGGMREIVAACGWGCNIRNKHAHVTAAGGNKEQ